MKHPDPQNTFLPFVIQQHQTADGVHWDLMLQMDTTLRTWRVDRKPQDIGGACVPIQRIDDHPLRFLTYEGPVQNKTGRVQIADHGRFEIIEQQPTLLVVHFDGIHLKGRYSLRQTETPNHWILGSV